MSRSKRWARPLVLVALVLPLAFLLGACNPWDMYGFDSTHSGGGQSGESFINATNAGSLTEAGTSAPISGSVIRSEPTSDGDLVFSTENVYEPPPACNNKGCHQGTLTATRADGTDNQRCSSNGGLTSCTPEWQVTPSNNEGLNTSPAYYDDTADGMSIVVVGDNAGRLWAYNAANGTLLWRSDLLSGEINGSITIDPVNGPQTSSCNNGEPDAQIVVTIVYGWTFFFPMTDGTDGCSQIPAPGAGTTTGDNCEMQSGIPTCFPQWGVAPGGDDESTPAIANSTMYTTSAAPLGSYLYAYADSYQPLTNWCGKNADKQAEIQYVGPGVKDAEGNPLLASCSPEWTASWEADASSPSVSVKNDLVYIGEGTTGYGAVEAFWADGKKSPGETTQCTGMEWSGETCTPDWVTQTAQRGSGATPVILPPNPNDPNDQDGIVYIGDESGDLQAYDAITGHILWSMATWGDIDSDAAIADAVDPSSGLSSNAVVYVGCSNLYEANGQTCSANLFGFNAETGAQLWTSDLPTGTNATTIDNGPIVIDNGSAQGVNPPTAPTEGALYVGASWGDVNANDPLSCFHGETPANCTSGVFAFDPSS